jgi:hypothetical protein
LHRISFLAKITLTLSLLNGIRAADTEVGKPVVVKTTLDDKGKLPEIVTDRPDYTESTDVAGRGVLQIENGFTVERSQTGHSLAGPELLMRIGLSKRLELRVGGDGVLTERRPGANRVSGFSDVDLGMKILLFDQGRNRPALSLIPIVSVPLGSAEFSSGGYDPTLKVALGKDLPKGFSLGGNVNFSSLNTPCDRFLQTALSASLGHSLGGGFRGYWEIFGFTPWEKDGSTAVIVNTGITRSIGKNAQVDIRVGKRLTESGPGWFWGMGVAFRQPQWPFFR